MQGGELPSGSGLAVWICKHLIKLRYKPCPCYLFCLTRVEDGVDPLGGPGACGSSLHVRQDKQDIAALIWELGVPHTEVKGAFCLEVVQVVLGAGEWRGGHNLGWLQGGDRGSARLGWRWRPAMMSKLGLEGCNLCCQLGNVLLSGHGGVLAWGLQGLSFLLLSGHIQDWEHMRHPGTCGAPTYLQGVTQGEWVPAECLSRSVIIMYKSKYIHKGLYLSRSEKKAAFSSYSSLALYNRWATWRKELNKKAVTRY